jgi:hypothetical protein
VERNGYEKKVGGAVDLEGLYNILCRARMVSTLKYLYGTVKKAETSSKVVEMRC